MSDLFISLVSMCAISFSLTWFFVPFCACMAHRFNLLDVPDGVIKLHKTATPYLGGIAVFFGTLLPCLLIIPFRNDVLCVFAGLMILLIVGLIDDLKILAPAQKMFGQFVAVCFFLHAGLYVHLTMCPYPIAIVISGFWMLTVINAFNLVDVMDGLASILAFCASCGFLILSICLQQVLLGFVFAAFMGSLIGFLYYNKPQAKIYLGDAGSLFIGGMLAVLPFGLNLGKYTHAGYLAPMFFMSIALLELVSLMVIRTYKKIPFYKGSPHHFSMFFQSYGWSKFKILTYCILCMTLANAVGLALVFNVLGLPAALVLSCVFLGVWIVVLMLHSDNYIKFLRKKLVAFCYFFKKNTIDNS